MEKILKKIRQYFCKHDPYPFRALNDYDTLVCKKCGAKQSRVIELDHREREKHPKCLGEYDYWGEFDCGYDTNLSCDECKYGVGRKDPAAKCNAH